MKHTAPWAECSGVVHAACHRPSCLGR